MRFRWPPKDRDGGQDSADHFEGLHVLRRACQCGCAPKVLVNSAWVSELADPTSAASMRALRQLNEALGKDASVFQKGAFNEDLCGKVFSILDLKARGYETDRLTRSRLYIIARRALDDKSEPVLILGKSGTGKEQAARHIHSVGQSLRLLARKQ